MLSAISAAITSASTPPKAPDAAQVFKQLDQDNKGYLTEADLTSAVVNISPEGAQQAQGDAQAMAKEAFARMDSDADGQVTEEEFAAATPPARPAEDQTAQAASAASGGTRPAGGGGGAGGAGAAGGSASSSETYDPADTNEDGTVSEQERLIYEAKQAAAKASEDNPVKAGDPAKDRQTTEAINTYEAVANAA